jgi:hypothetical protein
MKFLTSSTTDLDSQDLTGLFIGPNGNYFNYEVEYVENDFVRIKDSVGRIMPIDYTEVRDFAIMLTAIADHQEAQQLFEEINLKTLFSILNVK